MWGMCESYEWACACCAKHHVHAHIHSGKELKAEFTQEETSMQAPLALPYAIAPPTNRPSDCFRLFPMTEVQVASVCGLRIGVALLVVWVGVRVCVVRCNVCLQKSAQAIACSPWARTHRSVREINECCLRRRNFRTVSMSCVMDENIKNFASRCKFDGLILVTCRTLCRAMNYFPLRAGGRPVGRFECQDWC